MRIQPIPGRQVPDPEKGGVLPPQGRVVNDHDQYWQRRIADGDVVEAKAKAEPEQTTAPKGKAKE